MMQCCARVTCCAFCRRCSMAAEDNAPPPPATMLRGAHVSSSVGHTSHDKSSDSQANKMGAEDLRDACFSAGFRA
jgi:hypothetical protein